MKQRTGFSFGKLRPIAFAGAFITFIFSVCSTAFKSQDDPLSHVQIKKAKDDSVVSAKAFLLFTQY